MIFTVRSIASLLVFLALVTHSFGQDVSYMKRIAGSLADHSAGLVAGDSDRMYVCGSFTGTAGVDNKLSLTAMANADFFIACINSRTGVPIWAVTGGSTNADGASAIAKDANGNLYVTGSFVASCKIANTTIYATGNENGFIAKFTPDGRLCWLKGSNATPFSVVRPLAIDCNDSRLYVGGMFRGTALLNSDSLIAKGVSFDSYLMAMDTSGNLLWSKSAGGGSGNDQIKSIAANGSDIFVGGQFVDTLSWYGATKYSTGLYNGILKLDSSGQGKWIQSTGSGYYSAINDLELGDSMNLYFCGENGGTAEVGLVDSSGTMVWKHYASGGTRFHALTRAQSGEIYATGGFEHGASMGGFQLVSACACANNSYDYFMVAMNDTGKTQWVKYGGGGSFSDYGTAIDLDSRGNVLVAGDYATTSNFDHFQLSAFSGQQNETFYGRINTEKLFFRNLDTKLCANEGHLSLEFKILSDFDPSNTFHIYLSDSAGSFSNPQLLDSLNLFSATSDTLDILLPIPLKVSLLYNVLITSSSPVDTFYIAQVMRTLPYPVASFSVNDTVQCFDGHLFQLTNTSYDPVTNATIRWKYGNGVLAYTKNPVNLTYASAGIYACEMHIQSTNSCMDSMVRILQVGSEPVARIHDSLDSYHCQNSQITLTDSSQSSYSSGNRSYWFYNTQFIDSSSSITLPLNDLGWQTIGLVYVDSLMCIDTATKNIFVRSVIPVDSVYVTRHSCIGDTSYVDVIAPNHQISWLKDSVAAGTGFLLPVLTAGNYQFVSMDSNGCADTSDGITFSFYNRPAQPTINRLADSLYTSAIHNHYQWFKDEASLNGETNPVHQLLTTGVYKLRVEDDSFCYAWSDSLVVQSLTGLHLAKNVHAQVYPNPSSGLLHWTADFPVTKIELYTFDGKLIREYGVESELLSLDAFPSGMYLLLLHTEQGILLEKIILDRK